MAFTVEDGTGLADSNSYIDIEFADEYHSDRGNEDWQATDEAKEKLLIKATDYIDMRYGPSFKGQRLESATQALRFPRAYLYNDEGDLLEGIPAALKKATAEYALRALSQVLAPDPVFDDSNLLVSAIEEEVGPIREAKKFNAKLGIITLRPYPAADRLLQEFLPRSGTAIRG